MNHGESFLLNKVSKLKVFFSIIFEDMTEEEKALLEEKLIKCYENYDIFEANESLYIENEKSKIMRKRKFKEPNMMPKLEDLYDLLKKDKKLKRLTSLLKPYVSGTHKFLNNHTNVETNNKLVVVDVHDFKESEMPIVMFVVTEYFWDLIKNNRAEKKILYLDEVWKLINKNEYTAEFVFNLFKTIRKFGGGATAITQDISDFFMLQDGKYGKGIINNSAIKCVFQLEETDINLLEKVVNVSEEEKYKLLNMKRGSAIIHADRNALMVDVVASENEHKRITTDREDLEKEMRDLL